MDLNPLIFSLVVGTSNPGNIDRFFEKTQRNFSFHFIEKIGKIVGMTAIRSSRLTYIFFLGFVSYSLKECQKLDAMTLQLFSYSWLPHPSPRKTCMGSRLTPDVVLS
jgi:hypothetical protein